MDYTRIIPSSSTGSIITQWGIPINQAVRDEKQLRSFKFTLRQSNITMENGPFEDVFSIAMLVHQRVFACHMVTEKLPKNNSALQVVSWWPGTGRRKQTPKSRATRKKNQRKTRSCGEGLRWFHPVRGSYYDQEGWTCTHRCVDQVQYIIQFLYLSIIYSCRTVNLSFLGRLTLNPHNCSQDLSKLNFLRKLMGDFEQI